MWLQCGEPRVLRTVRRQGLSRIGSLRLRHTVFAAAGLSACRRPRRSRRSCGVQGFGAAALRVVLRMCSIVLACKGLLTGCCSFLLRFYYWLSPRERARVTPNEDMGKKDSKEPMLSLTILTLP